NCFGRRWADRVTKEWRLIGRFGFGFAENLASLGVLLPFALSILLSHERLFAHKEQIETPTCLARFAQGEVEGAAGAANGAQDGLSRQVSERRGRRHCELSCGDSRRRKFNTYSLGDGLSLLFHTPLLDEAAQNQSDGKNGDSKVARVWLIDEQRHFDRGHDDERGEHERAFPGFDR